ncbi:hypothetical protein MTX26_05545 [Bradyrhizobium sp. ISRA443]|uniref:hypothetical protein n=1 Tax=unclassified Bradyrhizobium TaxID=2631580 RepID=UPI002478828C|nr:MULTISPECIES: hypothetical protein [unclassified Bradyrhizobium]WGR95332.1 hypothetical protein MTX20_15725 [Bradyrhizobium sp. ISRA435]WGS00317.1 hypothetical protein MTX23_05545 [Bradyrhizobium sp. ISRA436]WGS07206.1 hypothetical protein MTX18_05545 [Bradyrhizobium sp. ISRA437]WGS14091.1 hypothetical protein MTX26_05545 [Bradyrhizobium sp. ISRA443]
MGEALAGPIGDREVVACMLDTTKNLVVHRRPERCADRIPNTGHELGASAGEPALPCLNQNVGQFGPPSGCKLIAKGTTRLSDAAAAAIRMVPMHRFDEAEVRRPASGPARPAPPLASALLSA